MTTQNMTVRKALPEAEGITLSKTEKLIQEIRKTPIFRQLIPMEAAIALPIPLRKEGKVYVTLPFYGTSKSNGTIALFPPFATITLDWSNQVPVEYVNLRFRNPAPQLQWEGQVGTFPHAAVTEMTVRQYQEKRRELLAMYDEMLETLTQDGSFSEQWISHFQQLLRTFIEPALEPYYRALNPKFFDRFLSVAEPPRNQFLG